MASGTRSQLKRRGEPLRKPTVYYAVNHKTADVALFDCASDIGQILCLLEDGRLSFEELDDAFQASLGFMAERGAGKPHPAEMKEAYEQHKHLKATLTSMLEDLCNRTILVQHDVRRRKPVLVE